MMKHKKIYILDTNVLVHDPQALFAFKGVEIGLPIVVLQELDQFKGENTQRGRNSRETIRILDELRQRGSFSLGITLDDGGLLRVLFMPSDAQPIGGLDISDPDNQILIIALSVKNKDYSVHFVSKDINMRVKADSLGLETHDYVKDAISEKHFYQGWKRVQAPSVQLKKEVPDVLGELLKEEEPVVNEFIIVESNHNPHNYKMFRYRGNGVFRDVILPELKWPIQPRNPQQAMALDLLFDPAIQLVTLMGPAGTGKTFLALVAALHEILINDAYEKLLITRPVIPLGPDIGYLPGDLQEKLYSWMQPIYDNMDFISHAAASSGAMGVYHEDTRGHHHGHKHYHHNHVQGKKKKDQKEQARAIPTLDDLVQRGKISLEAITYMRGRSIPYQYILIDEVQNLTPHEVKTLISRVGEGSKIILAGDPYQIDSPYLDFSSNGLVVASERFKGNSIFGSVFLEHSERSLLSQLAGQLL